MNDERRGIKVNIFGSEYAIRGEANEEYIQSLAHYVDEKMKEIAQSTHLTSPLKISILASINMADEIFRLREHLHNHNGGSGLSEKTQATPTSSIAPEAISALSRHIQSALEEE